MKTIAPAIVLLILYLGFACYVILSAQPLPERVATHFNGKGDPDGWMSPGQHVLFMLSFGSGMILFLLVVSVICRFIPDRLLNLPHREYWLAPQRRVETKDYIFQQMLWLTCLEACFFIGFNYSIVQANKHAPAQLYDWPFITTLACFFAGLVVWMLMLWGHFKRIEKDSGNC